MPLASRQTFSEESVRDSMQGLHAGGMHMTAATCRLVVGALHAQNDPWINWLPLACPKWRLR